MKFDTSRPMAQLDWTLQIDVSLDIIFLCDIIFFLITYNFFLKKF